MKRIHILLLILLSNTLFADGKLKDAMYNGNIKIFDNVIEADELVNFSLDELRLLRNMIYAKYGYFFQSKDLRDFFSQFPWYNDIKNDVSNDLTTIDYRNINMIKNLEKNYPVFMSYHDENIYEISDVVRYRGGLIIMGWSEDSKLFYVASEDFVDAYFEILDLKTHKSVNGYHSILNYFGDDIAYREYIDKILKSASDEYNIIPVTDGLPVEIAGYSISAKDITLEKIDYDPLEYLVTDQYIEINLINNFNDDIKKIGWFYLPVYGGYGEPVSINDLSYLCIRSPYEENIVVLIIIMPREYDGDMDGCFTVYRILSIDLNTLYE
jgi:hypothetical protein